MSSCYLFHGPGARVAALKKAKEIGHLIVPPIGDEGLKVKEAREAMGHLLNTPLLPGLGVLILGPMDEANSEAPDALLKGIEEFHGDVVQPILWARDLGGVPETIRSRCLDFWCPDGEKVIDDNDETPGVAWKLIECVREGNVSKMPEAIKGLKDKQVPKLIDALVEILVADLTDKTNQKVWGELRTIARWTNPKPVEVLAALMRSV